MHGQSRIEMSRPHHHQSNSSSYMGAPLAITAGPSHEIDPPRSRHSTHPLGYYISTHLINLKICLLTFDIVFDFKELALIGMLGRETATVLERAATRPQCNSPIEKQNRGKSNHNSIKLQNRQVRQARFFLHHVLLPLKC